MKTKVRIVDKIHGKVLEKEVSVPNKAHLDAQIKFKSAVFRDRTKYTRKIKHKNKEEY